MSALSGVRRIVGVYREMSTWVGEDAMYFSPGASAILGLASPSGQLSSVTAPRAGRETGTCLISLADYSFVKSRSAPCGVV